MSLYLKRFTYLEYTFALSLIFSLCLFFLELSQWVPASKISNFTAQLEFVVHLVTLGVSIPLFAKTNALDKTILKWFIIANIFLFLNDLTFYLAVYLPQNYILTNSFFTFVLGYIPYIVWISSIIILLSKMLIREVFSFLHFFRALPFFILINFIIIFLFFSSVHYAFDFFSWECISHLMSFMSEFIIFDFGLICLIYSENRGFSLMIFGIITLISGDFFVNYSFLSQTNNLLGYGELLWYLGLNFILFGSYFIFQKKIYTIHDWFSQFNTIKNRMALWSFGTSSASFLFFFTMVYFFSVIDKQIFLGLPIFVMMYSVIVVIFSIFMGKHFEMPFKKLIANIEVLMSHKDKSQINDNFSTNEFVFLQKFIIDAFEVKEQKDRAQHAMLNLTMQVAHDIRSPLAAINTVISDVKSVPENKRIVIRNSAKRINDIATYLLLQSKNNFPDLIPATLDTNISTELMFVVLENIIAEKKYEHYKQNIQIKFNISPDAYCCFVKISPCSFNRVLSNLINNSIEATELAGAININLNCDDKFVEITIEDSGCGIPPAILHKVTEKGFSFGKKEGAGLGLYHAKQLIEQLNGTLNIQSNTDSGTTISIKLLRYTPPKWFCEFLDITLCSRVVILDDDPSIYEAWCEKLSDLKGEIIYFSKSTDLTMQKINDLNADIYLIDYELLTEINSGLDFMEKSMLCQRSFLVTSCFEDTAIRERCEKLGVKIIPKLYVPFIPININEDLLKGRKMLVAEEFGNKDMIAPIKRPNVDVIILDDNSSLTDAWILHGEKVGKQVRAYNNIQTLRSEIMSYKKDIPIYIDSDLGCNLSGQELAKELYEQGFGNLYLCTGFPANSFNEMYWIKDILGKEAPF